MQKNKQIRILFSFIICIIFTSCAPVVKTEVPNTTTIINTHQPTTTSTITPITTSTSFPTPVPVSMQDSIEKGSFSEIDFMGNGKIQKSLFSPDGSIFVAITFRGVNIFDTTSWNQIIQIPLIAGESINSIVFSGDGKYFAAGDSSGKVTFWNADSWEVVQTIDVYNGPITSLDISPDNINFVAIGDEKEISLWNINDGSLLNSQIRSKNAGPANYSVDGTFIMVSEETMNNDLTTWSSTDLLFLDRFPNVGRQTPNQAFSPFKDIVASYGFQDLTIYNFETKEERKFKDLFGFFEKLSTMIFLNDSALIVKGENSDFYYLVGLKTNNLSQISYDQLVKMSVKNSEINIITKANEIKSLKFSPYSKIQNITKDGYSLILEEGILDLEEGSIVNNSKTADVSWINSIVLDDGNIGIVNTGQTDFWNKINKGKVTITIFDSRDYSVLTTKKIEYDLTEGIQTAALSHDGAMLATGLYDGSLILWNVNSKEQIAIIRAHDSISGMGQYAAFRKIIFSNDGALLATVGYDGNVKVWNTADLKEIKSVRGNDPVFSKDGRYLAYSLSDNRIQVLPIFEEVYPITFDGKYSWVSKIMFFNEDKFLITGGYPGVIKIWSIADNSLIVELPQFTSVGNFVLDPKEERLYISTTDGIISVWGNNPKQ